MDMMHMLLKQKDSFHLTVKKITNVQFKEVIIYDTEKFYTLAYSNGIG